MMRANPNVKKAPRMGKSLNKLTIINNSDFEVKYHAEFYEDTAVVHDEKEGNVKIMGFGAGGNNKKDFVKGELLDPEISSIPPKGTTDITVDESKKVKLKYYYIGLHNDYTDEQRNFTVYDEVLFDQPHGSNRHRLGYSMRVWWCVWPDVPGQMHSSLAAFVDHDHSLCGRKSDKSR